MLTRIASFAQHSQLLSQLMRNQVRLDTTQEQVSTGKKSSDYQGLGSEAQALLAAKSLTSRTEQYLSDARKLQATTGTHTQLLEQQRKVGNDLISSLNSAASNFNGTGLVQAINNALAETIRTLNTSYDGKYMFGGTRTDTAPVTIANATDLLALPALSNAFANGDTKLSVQIDENRTISYGELADQVGTQYLSVLRNLLEYNAGTYAGAGGPGTPLQGQLSTAQIQFLQSQVQSLRAVNTDMLDRIVVAGQAETQVDDTVTRLEAQRTSAKALVSDIEDVDSAEAISNLNRDQLALQVSYKVTSELNQSTLLDYL
jgi:flagellar hook-associated protein 3 FlgL